MRKVLTYIREYCSFKINIYCRKHAILLTKKNKYFSYSITGVGTRETNAHVDFFPNQGYNQPGCGINEFSASEILRMSHIAGNFN